ncbi:MAG TPA: hypothetical protein VJX74_02065 [Blastocatellia bacterium]|nr:hypothetical protein [Blastocatellia bacterium]
MSLSKRIAAIEAQAAPAVEAYKRAQQRRVLGRFGMMRLFTWGFTHAESLDVLADAHKRRGRGESLADAPHWTGPHIYEAFQSFLATDSEAAELYRSILAFRVEGEAWADSISRNAEEIATKGRAIWSRMRDHFLEVERADWLLYEAAMEKGRDRMRAKDESEQSN